MNQTLIDDVSNGDRTSYIPTFNPDPCDELREGLP